MSMMVRTGTLYRNRNRRNSRATSVRQANRKMSLAVPPTPRARQSVSAPSSPRNSITSLSPRASLHNTPRRSLQTSPNRSTPVSPRGSVTAENVPSKSSLKSKHSSRVRLDVPDIAADNAKGRRNSSLRVTLAPSVLENDRRHSSASVSVSIAFDYFIGIN